MESTFLKGNVLQKASFVFQLRHKNADHENCQAGVYLQGRRKLPNPGWASTNMYWEHKLSGKVLICFGGYYLPPLVDIGFNNLTKPGWQLPTHLLRP